MTTQTLRAALLLWVLAAGSTAAAADCRILTPPDASPLETLAAREARRYLYVRTGALATVTNDPAKSETTAVAVTRRDRALAGDAGRDLGPQQFRLQTVTRDGRKTIFIVGGDDVGTLYGAYRFAEKLGVRFYLHGDVVPDERIAAIPDMDDTGQPLFGLRGVNPWGSHPFGFDAWGTDDYKAVFTQLAKLRMNFLAIHCYPEGHPYAEPTVWHGLPGEFDDRGRVTAAYVSHYYNTLVPGTWGPLLPKKTSDYSFGGPQLFADDAWAPQVMQGFCPLPTTPEQCQEVFNRMAAQFQDAFTFARPLGIKTCIGTEAPLIMPKAVRERLQAAGKNPDDPAVVREVYEATFRRIRAAHPLDYYWIWTPEGWTWGGNKPEQYAATVRDVRLAYEALKNVGAPFQLATCGWVLGPQHDRAALDADLPKDVPMSAISRALGYTEVDPAFGRIAGREKWAIPWLESDSHHGLAGVQLVAGRMRRDAADALAHGCTGLMGLQWRTDILAPNVSALAQAAWDQSGWNPAPGKTSAETPPTTEGPLGGAVADYPGRPIANAADPLVYRTCRYNFDGYNLRVPNGRYRVTLQFCEPHFDAAGKRIGDFTLQGKVVAEKLDIFARVGKFAALDIACDEVLVSDGWLRLRIIARESWPCLSGIVIQTREKGDRSNLPERPGGCCAQIGPVPFFTRKINCGGPAHDGYEADLEASVPQNRFLPCDDFYADWARANFGPAAADDIARIFAAIDGQVPVSVAGGCPSGALTPLPDAWATLAEKYAFIDPLAAARTKVQGAGNLDRFDYWLNTFRYHRTLAQIRCALGAFEAAMKRAEEAKSQPLAAAEALPAYTEVVRLYGDAYRLLLATVNTPGGLAMVVNLENHSQFWPVAIERPAQRLASLGIGLPPNALPAKRYTGEPRLIVPCVRSLLGRGEPLRLTVIVLDNGPVSCPTLSYRSLGAGPWRQVSLSHTARAVYRAELPAPAADFEYHVEATCSSGQKLVWPATAPEINQTVVVW